MLNSVRPEEAKGKDTKLLREMLDRVAARVDKELKDQLEVQASLRVTIGRTYYELGQYAKAEVMYRKALTIEKKLLGSHTRRAPHRARWESPCKALDNYQKPNLRSGRRWLCRRRRWATNTRMWPYRSKAWEEDSGDARQAGGSGGDAS